LLKLVALVVAVAAFSVTAAQAASNPALTFNVSGYKVLFGHKLTLSGRLASGAVGQPVGIFSRRFGNDSMLKIATVKTAGGGKWTYAVEPSISTTYQARVGLTVTRSLTVGVKPAVTVSQLGDGTIWTHIAAGGSFAGQLVELQHQTGTSWTTVAKAALNSSSSVTFPSPIAAGTETVRIAMSVNQAGSGFLGANSDPLLFHAMLVTLTPTAKAVLYGNTLELTGRISSKQAGQIVTILGWKYGHSSPTKSTIVITRAGGFWNTSDKPTIRTSYQARWSGNSSSKVVVGVAANVTVTQLISGKISAHLAAGHPLTGRLVELQEMKPGLGWTTLAQLPLNRNGNATFPAPITTGTATLRIAMSVNQAGAGYLGASSHELAYQTKFVSILAPATKVLYGKSLSLTGQISSLTSSEKITILAWKFGRSAPVKVGSVSTLAGGHWSFPVKPGIQTSYVARWGGSTSTKILVGVEPLATLSTLANGRIAANVSAGSSFTGKKILLQELRLGVGWRTISQGALNRHSSFIFPQLVASRTNQTLRLAMSVNQAGAGFLGTLSHAFIYRGK
jgi:hypothetical protein